MDKQTIDERLGEILVQFAASENFDFARAAIRQLVLDSLPAEDVGTGMWSLGLTEYANEQLRLHKEAEKTAAIVAAEQAKDRETIIKCK